MIIAMAKIFFNLLILSMLVIQFPALPVFGKTAPDHVQLHEESVKKPVSTEHPVFLTRFFTPETYKSAQFSKIGGFSDLLISESVSPATFTQRKSTIARLTDGRTVIGWTDVRNGSQMIFIQIFDSEGNRSGSNIMAIGRDDQYDISNPCLVSDGSGGFFLGWRDDATGWIYVSRFDSDLNKQTEFRINNPALGYAGLYDIAFYPGGKLAAVWEQYSISNSINFCIFSNDGIPLTENITINGDDGTATYWAPSIAVEPSGNLAVTWEDYRNGDADIYMQFVNSDGSLYGSNHRIIDFDYIDEEQYLPEIAYSATDGYIIAWLDKRSGIQRVFLQRTTRSGGLIGNNVNISNNAEKYTDWFISMAVNSSGNLAVAWSSVNDTDKVLMRKFTTDVSPDGPIITVRNFASGSSWETSLEFDNADNLYCTWSDSRHGNWDIMLKQYGSDGSPLSEDDIIVNDDEIGAHSTQPVANIYHISPGYSVVFSDSRNDAGDIYYHAVDDFGQSYSINIKINEDIVPALQRDPYAFRIKGEGAESVAITWTDERAINGIIGQRIFLRTIRSENELSTWKEELISDTNSITPKACPKFVNGSFTPPLIAWIDYENGDGQVYAKYMFRVGDSLQWSDNFPVSHSDYEFDNTDINLMAEDSFDPLDTSHYTIAWLSRGIEGGPAVIFARHKSSTFDLVDRFSFTSDQTAIEIKEIVAAENFDDDIYLLWRGQGNGNTYLYLTVLDKTGEVIHPTFEITNGIGGVKEGIDIAIDYHGVVVATWVDDRNGRDEVFYQIFYPDLTPYGANLPASPTEQRYMMSPTVAIDGQNAVIAWVDPRANGHNVYMTQIDYSSTDINDDNRHTLPSGYRLEQNYPNPFNPSTSIQFALPAKSHVKLEVYNLLGRKIATITDHIFESGTHTVNWDGKNSSGEQSASGIYFYRMEAGQFEQTRKMILLK